MTHFNKTRAKENLLNISFAKTKSCFYFFRKKAISRDKNALAGGDIALNFVAFFVTQSFSKNKSNSLDCDKKKFHI